VEVCWTTGEHELDGDFDCGKQLRGEYLQWAFRVTKFSPPSGRVKAAYKVELKGIMDAAGANVPTAKMKREAREAAQARIEEEGQDGRYLKRTLVPVVWDGATGEVWYGASSHSHLERFTTLFMNTFGVDVTPITSGQMVNAETEIEPCFMAEPPVWCPDGLDWMGNEFAMWCLWRHHGTNEDVQEVPVNKLTLACPLGAGGTDTFTHEFPGTMPEVKRALADGKVPRQLGLIFLDDKGSVSLTLDPERWVLSGVKLPDIEGVRPGPERDLARLDQCRQVFQSADELYRSLLDIRLSDDWNSVRDQIIHWTGHVPSEV
jgi:hypothetical protein